MNVTPCVKAGSIARMQALLKLAHFGGFDKLWERPESDSLERDVHTLLASAGSPL